jgi:hypothetical protein
VGHLPRARPCEQGREGVTGPQPGGSCQALRAAYNSEQSVCRERRHLPSFEDSCSKGACDEHSVLWGG